MRERGQCIVREFFAVQFGGWYLGRRPRTSGTSFVILCFMRIGKFFKFPIVAFLSMK